MSVLDLSLLPNFRMLVEEIFVDRAIRLVIRQAEDEAGGEIIICLTPLDSHSPSGAPLRSAYAVLDAATRQTRWSGPLHDSVARITAEGLLRGGRRVSLTPANLDADTREILIRALEASHGDLRARMEADLDLFFPPPGPPDARTAPQEWRLRCEAQKEWLQEMLRRLADLTDDPAFDGMPAG